MKKAIKIGGAALVIFIFFPGLPTYIRVKHKYDNINSRVAEFPRVDVPADYKEYTVRGAAFRLPADWKPKIVAEGLTPSSYRSADNKSMIMAIKYDQSYHDILYGEEALYDPWEGYEHSEDDYRHFFSKVGADYPEKWLNILMIWLVRDGFTAKDCLKLRGTDLKVFKELSDIKEDSEEYEKSWKTSGEGFRAYIGQVTGLGYDGGIWTYTILPDGSEDIIVVTLKCADEATARKIVSTIKLA